MTNVLGFQKLKICEPHGINDILVVKIDGNCLVGFSTKFNWVKLQEGAGDFGYVFRANNELEKYNINWNIVKIEDIDNKNIGKISLCYLYDELTPVIVEVISIEEYNEQKKLVNLKIFDQVVYNFETEENVFFETIKTIVTMQYKDSGFIIEKFEPDIIINLMDYEDDDISIEGTEHIEDYIVLNEIISTKIFGNISFLIFNNKISSKINKNNHDIFIELENQIGNINNDNIDQLKIIIESYYRLKTNCEEYIKINYSNNYKIQDFFTELFLSKIDEKNVSEINEKMDILNELTVIEKIKLIPFSKMMIICSNENKYSIKIGFNSGIRRNSTTLWFLYDNKYLLKDFCIDEGKSK